MIQLEGKPSEHSAHLYREQKESFVCFVCPPQSVLDLKKKGNLHAVCSLKNEKTRILNTISEISWEG